MSEPSITVEKLLQRHQGSDQVAEQDAVEDHGAYALVRGIRDRALMVELRKKDGSVLALPYAVVEQVKFSPEQGITIHACGREVRIEGRNLNGSSDSKMGLFSGLCRYRVAWVQECGRMVESRQGAAEVNVTAIRM